MTAPSKMRNPAPRANAGSRVNSNQVTINNTTRRRASKLDFEAINCAALAAFPAVLRRLLPNGKTLGREFVALNPRRADCSLGSFKVNRYNGRWADFATGERGGDPISLVAYLAGVSQGEAARLLANMLGIDAGGPHHG